MVRLNVGSKIGWNVGLYKTGLLILCLFPVVAFALAFIDVTIYLSNATVIIVIVVIWSHDDDRAIY